MEETWRSETLEDVVLLGSWSESIIVEGGRKVEREPRRSWDVIALVDVAQLTC